jgi:hypothetical protein
MREVIDEEDCALPPFAKALAQAYQQVHHYVPHAVDVLVQLAILLPLSPLLRNWKSFSHPVNTCRS